MKWPTVAISSGVADVIRGVTFSRGDSLSAPSADSVAVLRAGNISDQLVTDKDLVWIPAKFVAESQRLRAGDIVVCTSSGSRNIVGKSAFNNTDFDGTWGAFNAVVRSTSNVNSRYLFYWMQSPAFFAWRDRQATGANIQNIRHSALASMPILLPPPSEQRRIVEILDQADALRKLRREADAKAARILPALFLKMFGDPAANPMGWPTKAIGKLGNVVTGKTPPTKNDGMFGGDIPFATPGDLDNGLVTIARTVTELGAEFSKTVRAGSALVGCIGNVGKMAKTPTRTAFNQQINAVEWGEHVNDDFGITALSFMIPVMQALATSTTLPILNKSAFSSIHIIVPPRALQEKFSRIAQGTTQVSRAITNVGDKLQSVFGVLLSRAFSGQLTAKWRQAHMQELLVEMREQARLLDLPMPDAVV